MSGVVIDLLAVIAVDPGLNERYAAVLKMERAQEQENGAHVRGSPRWREIRDEETEPRRTWLSGRPMFEFDLDCDDPEDS